MAKWKTIRVPEELWHEIKALTHEYEAHRGDALWRVIAKALSHYKPALHRGFKNASIPRLDKAAWYAFKLASSVGALKENPGDSNLELLKTTCRQIEDRLGISMQLVIKAAEVYKKRPTTQNKVELNDVVKLAITDILTKLLVEG